MNSSHPMRLGLSADGQDEALETELDESAVPKQDNFYVTHTQVRKPTRRDLFTSRKCLVVASVSHSSLETVISHVSLYLAPKG